MRGSIGKGSPDFLTQDILLIVWTMHVSYMSVVIFINRLNGGRVGSEIFPIVGILLSGYRKVIVVRSHIFDKLQDRSYIYLLF